MAGVAAVGGPKLLCHSVLDVAAEKCSPRLLPDGRNYCGYGSAENTPFANVYRNVTAHDTYYPQPIENRKRVKYVNSERCPDSLLSTHKALRDVNPWKTPTSMVPISFWCSSLFSASKTTNGATDMIKTPRMRNIFTHPREIRRVVLRVTSQQTTMMTASNWGVGCKPTPLSYLQHHHEHISYLRLARSSAVDVIMFC